MHGDPYIAEILGVLLGLPALASLAVAAILLCAAIVIARRLWR